MLTENPGQRSAIGIKSDGRVLMVTGSNLKISELATIMQTLGCHSATNLDGGASSALYAEGKYLTYPGRKLNTVLVVHETSGMKSAASIQKRDIKVQLNGEALRFDVPPTIVNGRTLVPLRGIFEAMDAEIQWDDANKTVTAQKGRTTIVLQIGSNLSMVNGKQIEMDVPGTIVDGRTLVPARFIA